MPNVERYGVRDLAYSKWHRLQGRRLAYIDIDSLEYCEICKTPLALIELAQDVGQTVKPVTVMRRLAIMSHIPAFLVLYKKSSPTADEILGFRVKTLTPTYGDFETLTVDEYKSFLYILRANHDCYRYNSLNALGEGVTP